MRDEISIVIFAPAHKLFISAENQGAEFGKIT